MFLSEWHRCLIMQKVKNKKLSHETPILAPTSISLSRELHSLHIMRFHKSLNRYHLAEQPFRVWSVWMKEPFKMLHSFCLTINCRVSHLMWNPIQQHTIGAVSTLPANKLVTMQNTVIECQKVGSKLFIMAIQLMSTLFKNFSPQKS